MEETSMWSIISNISSVVTCVAFILYLIGHIWAVLKNKYTIYEKFTVVPCDFNFDIKEEDNALIVDDIGCEFSIESEYGINEIKIYKVDYDINGDGSLHSDNRKLKSTFNNLQKEKLYIRCDLGEYIPTTQFEIERSDYATITFDIYQSGKNGHIVIGNYKYKLTFRGFLYHLCI